MTNKEYDAIVIGAGPNGLAAAIAIASHGLSVLVLEEKKTIGGGCRTEELTLPDFLHDVCSSIHPLAIGSPFFRTLPLQEHGLEWIQPLVPLAHPFEDGTCALLQRSVQKTGQSLGGDASAYEQLFSPFVNNWSQLENTILGPLTIPSHPLLTLQFAWQALRSAESLAKTWFKNPRSQALFAGIAAHSILPLDQTISAAAGLLLGITGHVFGWPMPKGGAQSITNALGSYFLYLGGIIKTGVRVDSLKDLPSSRAVIVDLTPRQLLQIAGDELTPSYKRQLKKYRYGPGVFKMDWALSQPIPWKAPECLQAGTLHLGGYLDQIAASEKTVWEGNHSENPYVLLAQNSLFDPTRAPVGKHTAWAYCHVPHNSQKDMTQEIENQIERYAPGFRDCVLARSTKNTLEMTQFNSNYIGGDITGGVQDIWQLFTRPTTNIVPYLTSNPRLFICSSSTPPGGGVHGMCGYHAAKVVLKRVFGITA
jgi:phytoene dehydrogenase-like protein